jgi:hypothetical protein
MGILGVLDSVLVPELVALGHKVGVSVPLVPLLIGRDPVNQDVQDNTKRKNVASLIVLDLAQGKLGGPVVLGTQAEQVLVRGLLREVEVSYLDIEIIVQKNIFELQIEVGDAFAVQQGNTLDDLSKDGHGKLEVNDILALPHDVVIHIAVAGVLDDQGRVYFVSRDFDLVMGGNKAGDVVVVAQVLIDFLFLGVTLVSKGECLDNSGPLRLAGFAGPEEFGSGLVGGNGLKVFVRNGGDVVIHCNGVSNVRKNNRRCIFLGGK